MQKRAIPRGIRNNNPLNIRIGNTWLGEVDTPDETQFEQFVSMEYGVRAAFIILRRYIRRYKRCTVEAIISSWAPSSENQTEKYAGWVAAQMGIDVDTPIDYADRETMVSLVSAMARYENGQSISDDVIRKGYNMA